jgi:IS4 transposase
MVLNEVFNQFVEDTPVSVIFRAAMENLFSAERLDGIFRTAAQEQYEGGLLFSTCADLLGLAVARIHRSVNGAYQKKKEQVGVSIQAVYQKLARVEPLVCATMVADTAAHLAEVLKELGSPVESPLTGYDVRIVDGNHLAGTEHRLKELRGRGAAALPGQAIVVLDPQRRLLERVLLCEDGHANQRPLMPQLLPYVQREQCWIEDRDFCTLPFLFGVKDRHAYFIVRQHAQLQGELQGRRRKIDETDTGTVYEQRILLRDAEGRRMRIRRITIELKKPTRDGEMVVHVLTNLPTRVGTCRIAEAYRQRWHIETAFEDLAVSLRGEVNTLAYPRAALFGFCLALRLYNVLSVTRSALETAQPKPVERARASGRKVSIYALAEEIAGVYRGMMIAIPAEHWRSQFATLTAVQFAAVLLQLAAKVRLNEYLTYPQHPRRPLRKRKGGGRGNHVSTFQVLQKRKNDAQMQTKCTFKCLGGRPRLWTAAAPRLWQSRSIDRATIAFFARRAARVTYPSSADRRGHASRREKPSHNDAAEGDLSAQHDWHPA